VLGNDVRRVRLAAAEWRRYAVLLGVAGTRPAVRLGVRIGRRVASRLAAEAEVTIALGGEDRELLRRVDQEELDVLLSERLPPLGPVRGPYARR
jgi:hypothetical protein